MGLLNFFRKEKPSKPVEKEAPPEPQNTAAEVIPLTKLVETLSEHANTDAIYGQTIPEAIKTYKSLYNEDAGQEKIKQAFLKMMKELDRSLLIVLFHYENDTSSEPDMQLHLTSLAARMLNRDSIVYRAQNMTAEQLSKLGWIIENEIPTIDSSWWDISRIADSDGYHFDASAQNQKTMYPQIVRNQVGSFFLCYSGIDILKSYPNNMNGRLALFSMRDIANYLLQSPHLDGFIINPDTDSHCFISSSVFRRN